MLRNNKSSLSSILTIKILSISISTMLLTACGGGDDSEATALGLEDVAIAFIKRPTPRDQDGIIIENDLREVTSFTEGGDLYIQKSATAAAQAINVTQQITNGLGDVKDVNVSYDGTKLIFSLRLQDLNPNDQIIPRWYIYEYDITSDTVTQLTSAGTDDGDDVSPNYLSDGRIVFSSNRQAISKTIRSNELRGAFIGLNEDRSTPTFALHILEFNGDYTQISFNRSNDIDPTILQDSGRILFSRWNNVGGRDNVSLFTMNPDGSDVRLYYGAHSHNTGQAANTRAYSKPREMGDGRIMAILRPYLTSFGGGDIVFIDGKNFADNTQPIWSQQASITGTAQTIFKQNVEASNGLAISGRYSAVFPMIDGTNRFLMSWSECRIMDDRQTPPVSIPCTLADSNQLTDPNLVEATPSYGIYLVDNTTQALLVKPEDDKLISSIVMVYPRNTPVIPNASAGIDFDLAEDGIGVLHIRSVYDFDNSFQSYGASLPNTDTDGNPVTIDSVVKLADPKNATAADRPARFIRVIKGVSHSDPINVAGMQLSNSAFGNGTQRQLGMQEIIGYAPVEPDGSVKIKVPANVPLTISILDKDGRRISTRDANNRLMTNRHQSWFQVNPGATLECVGCHVHDTRNQSSNKPHGRPDYTSKFNPGATTTGIGFPNSLNSLTAEIDETMAETRARKNDCSPNPTPCDVMKPSINLIYNDVWTDEVAANRSADPSFTLDYSLAPVSPGTSGACVNPSSDSYNKALHGTNSYTYCRVVINYEEHIHPMWKQARAGNECINCHTTAGNTQVADGQLELTDGDSIDEPDHFHAYRELVSNDNKQVLSGTTLIDEMVQDTDNNGNLLFLTDGNGNLVLDVNLNPIPIMVPVNVSPSMSNNGALNSRFMELMTGEDLNKDGNLPTDTGAVHKGLLNTSELKLISEWLDLGGQYFNNPFHADAPTN